MYINVLEQGLLTTVQDLGRTGYQQFGVGATGAMDDVAAKLANLLIGNDENDALLEITVIGPTLRFVQDTLIAIAGADLSATIEGERVPRWKPVFVKAGTVLKFGRPKNGCRAYLAISGGFNVPIIMDSRSTYLRGGFGGYKGRALQRGDMLQMNNKYSKLTQQLLTYFHNQRNTTPFITVNWTIPPSISKYVENKDAIYFIKGPHFNHLNVEATNEFLTTTYTVTPNSDRMGYRLNGVPLKLSKSLQLLSEAVPVGTIQLPPDGQPIVLMADRQTIGGYPKIGYIATIDLPRLAQFMPGEKVKFKEISVQEAQVTLAERDRVLTLVQNGINLAIRRMC
ncbi:biotin-dependent carboxyltransferase family protein [Metabacillus malikii]|uniref:Antagonist of KipI n=1 Tax=Metabacillus malikii TaxID=1504265 RepID=A0ABT9ZES5_9BACI|nr:biotin-dependent carboxyltransferase family protein [Metabacillus malikii]MDQ0230771.1 antagonist of KipI [Metabacillus malikii]